jgi:hypothetical protein
MVPFSIKVVLSSSLYTRPPSSVIYWKESYPTSMLTIFSSKVGYGIHTPLLEAYKTPYTTRKLCPIFFSKKGCKIINPQQEIKLEKVNTSSF